MKAAQVSALDPKQMLEQRYHQIDEINELMRTQSCIQELVERFLGQSKPSVDQMICTNAFGMGSTCRTSAS
ncbi:MULTISPECIES: hypothetical protein [Mesorhizobium]|uniref:Transposase n=2 Tax=Mesorhizobium TaxID=68287 RepID=A0ABU4X3F7_9HYPH|nr:MULTISPECIES: hypothetical protein [unclassified Mesorhizobium]MDX8442488.1 hypothetical protein [Mesorhizobium sp. VK3E]MDX8528920.1 hypothetical protein [Mesorhizobium sp. MSK_1335]